MEAARTEGPQGMGGWLAFYVWSNLITLPIFIAAMISYPEYVKSIPPQLVDYFPKEIPVYERLSLAFVAAFQDYACLLLLSRRPRAVGLARQSLLAQMGYIVAKSTSDALTGVGGVALNFVVCANALVFPAAWYFYFKLSRRVRNTYENAE